MLASHVARQERLYRIAAPLLVKNALLCRTNSRALLGFTAKNRMSYSADMVDDDSSATFDVPGEDRSHRANGSRFDTARWGVE